MHFRTICNSLCCSKHSSTSYDSMYINNDSVWPICILQLEDIALALFTMGATIYKCLTSWTSYSADHS